MSRRYRTWHETEVEYFREHPEEIQLYLDVAFEEAEKDGNWAAFMASVRTVAEVKGGIGELAGKLECSRTNLYKTLSEEGNPRLSTLASILQALGYRLSVQPAAVEAVGEESAPYGSAKET